jgi:hypothetical protein
MCLTHCLRRPTLNLIENPLESCYKYLRAPAYRVDAEKPSALALG